MRIECERPAQGVARGRRGHRGNARSCRGGRASERRACRGGGPASSGRALRRSGRCGRGPSASTSSPSIEGRSARAVRASASACGQADAVVDVEQRRLEVGLDPVGDEQPLDHADQRVLLARLRRLPVDPVEVAELRHVLRQRDPVDGLLLERDRGAIVALRRLDPGRARRARSGSRERRAARRGPGARRQPRGRSTSRACRAGSASRPRGSPCARAAWTASFIVVDRLGHAAEQLEPVRDARVRGEARVAASPSCRMP